MAYFPFFIEINGKSCVVAGGGKIAFRKIEVLSKFNTKIVVIAPAICEEITALKKELDEAANNENEQIVLIKRDFEDIDVMDTDFVIAATNDISLNSHIAKYCKENNKLVNVVDVKEECSFVFPAIIKKGELVIAISTGGNSPAMAAKIKKDIEDVIPEYYVELIELLGKYRDYIGNNVHLPENRKKVYHDMISAAVSNEGDITFELMQKIVNKYR